MKEKFDGLVSRLLEANIFLQEAVEILEKSMIQLALEKSGGNQCSASKALGIHRNTLQRKIVEYGIGKGRTRKPVSADLRTAPRKSGIA
jgi:DNA-binding NtrC family response regulator